MAGGTSHGVRTPAGWGPRGALHLGLTFPPPNLSPVNPAGMLTITDFILVLHRYYRSPLVSSGVSRGLG